MGSKGPNRSKPAQASFKIQPKMTKWEVKEYLTKIYNVPVKKVRRLPANRGMSLAVGAYPWFGFDCSFSLSAFFVKYAASLDACSSPSARFIAAAEKDPMLGADAHRESTLGHSSALIFRSGDSVGCSLSVFSQVMTQNFEGKRKRIMGKRSNAPYKRPNFKKAIVTFSSPQWTPPTK